MGITSHITEDYISYQAGNTPARSPFNDHLRTGCDNYQTKLKVRRNVIVTTGIHPGDQIFAALFSEASSSVPETESHQSFD